METLRKKQSCLPRIKRKNYRKTTIDISEKLEKNYNRFCN